MRHDGYERYRRSKYYGMGCTGSSTPTARKEKGGTREEQREVRSGSRAEWSGVERGGEEWRGEEAWRRGGRRRAKESQARPGTR